MANKSYLQLIRRAEKLGCSVEQKKSGHMHIRTPEGRLVVASSTNPRGRSEANLRARLRRNGVMV